nr:hypothetical protein [Tanacetum cinerariifolium]
MVFICNTPILTNIVAKANLHKKLKAAEVLGSDSTQETPSNDPKEMSEEDVQNMLEIVLVSEFKVEALQVKYPIIDWEIHSKGFVEKKALWVELKKLFEPDADDVLWKLQSIAVAGSRLMLLGKVDTAAEVTEEITLSDYSLWEVILNGDSLTPTRIVNGAIQIIVPTTAEQRLAKKNKFKARGTLLMALPNKHQLKFNIYKDARSLLEAIEKRFRGNKETKKVQKTLLKQQYKNFIGKSSESLDQIHDRLQKLISQLEILGETVSQKDIHLKFLRSLPSEWKTHTLIWRNKADLEEQSLDDLFNNLKIYEAEVKSSSTSSQTIHNIAFVSSNNTDSTDESVNDVPSVFAASSKALSNSPQLDNEDLKKIDPDDLEEMDLRWQIAMLTIRARRLLPNLSKLLESQVSDKAGLGFDSQVFNSQVFDCKEAHSPESDDSVPKSTVNDRINTVRIINSVRVGKGYHVVPPPYAGTFMPPKPDLVFNDSLTANWTSDSEDENKIESVPKQIEPSFVSTFKHVKPPKKSVKEVENPKQAKNLRTDNQKSRDCDYYEKLMVQKPVWNNAMRVTHQNSVRMTHPHSNRNVVPTAVLTRSRLVSLNAARTVPTVVPQTTMKSPRPVTHVFNKAHSPLRRPINHRPATKNSNFNKKVSTVKVNKVNVVQGTRGNAEKSLANWVWKPKCTILDHVSRLTSASMTLKKFNYTDALGRSKSVMAWVPKRH